LTNNFTIIWHADDLKIKNVDKKFVLDILIQYKLWEGESSHHCTGKLLENNSMMLDYFKRGRL